MALSLTALVTVVACAQEDTPLSPQFSHAGWANAAHLQVCKVGTAASFDILVNDPSTGPGADVDLQDVPLADGECRIFYDVPLIPETPSPAVEYIVTENVPVGTALTKIVQETFSFSNTPLTSVDIIGSNTASGVITDDIGAVLTFHNTAVAAADGRMTGGGNPKIDGVNFGLTLHCDITLSNNLEINWDGGNWHLSKPIDSAVCIDDVAIDPAPPAAPFDTFQGVATGRLDGTDGSVVHFEFIDAGEPGRNDLVSIQVWAVGDDPSFDAPILDVSGNLEKGNLQAHFDQPHR